MRRGHRWVAGAAVLAVVALGVSLLILRPQSQRESADLSWQLPALESNWAAQQVTLPAYSRLVKYYSSDPGPHGDHDAVYVVAVDNDHDTITLPPGGGSTPTTEQLKALSNAGATAFDATHDQLRCLPLASNGARWLLRCASPTLPAHQTILIEHLPDL